MNTFLGRVAARVRVRVLSGRRRITPTENVRRVAKILIAYLMATIEGAFGFDLAFSVGCTAAGHSSAVSTDRYTAANRITAVHRIVDRSFAATAANIKSKDNFVLPLSRLSVSRGSFVISHPVMT